jgi:cytidine deaminase
VPELTRELQEQLLTTAREARERAYAPYSKFPVGAALLTKSGQVYAGCNVENASFGLTICAERVAINSAVAAGDRAPVAVAVLTARDTDPAAPCGACRQVLSEFNPRLKVVLPTSSGGIEVFGLDELLPESFGPTDLDPDLDIRREGEDGV